MTQDGEPTGKESITDADRKKAKVFFDKGEVVAKTGNHDYAVELYVQGLGRDPEAVQKQKELRDISLRRKASGGKPLGMFKKPGKAKTPREAVLNATKLLAFDPGNVEYMIGLMKACEEGGFTDSALWAADVTQQAIFLSAKPDYNKLITLKDAYKRLGNWSQAIETLAKAMMVKPGDGELNQEMKNLSAEQTMKKADYGSDKGFKASMKDADKQQQFIEEQRDVRSGDYLSQRVVEAEAEYHADPTEPGKISRLVDALRKTEKSVDEKRAIEVLKQAFQDTQQYRFRLAMGQIRMVRLDREQKAMFAKVNVDRENTELAQEYQTFLRKRYEFEYDEFKAAAKAYPTDQNWKFKAAQRLFVLGRYDEAIPMLQQAQNDAKLRIDSQIMLGRAFLQAEFLEEAVSTLTALIDSYADRGSDRSKDMHYWLGRSLEQRGDMKEASKHYSQLAQWDFNYKDVQERIKKVRAAS